MAGAAIVEGGARRRRQTAEFEPSGLAGRLYGHALLPVHAVMFGGMIRAIARRAAAAAPGHARA